MKIITVNIEKQHIAKIKTLTGDEALYPSRSELIRVAIRDFLLKELKKAETKTDKVKNEIKEDRFNPSVDPYVLSIPVGEVELEGITLMEYKKYKLIGKNGVKFKDE